MPRETRDKRLRRRDGKARLVRVEPDEEPERRGQARGGDREASPHRQPIQKAESSQVEPAAPSVQLAGEILPPALGQSSRDYGLTEGGENEERTPEHKDVAARHVGNGRQEIADAESKRDEGEHRGGRNGEL